MALIKTNVEIAQLRESGRILALAMDALVTAVKPGITTQQLDDLFVSFIADYPVSPAFLGYQGFPKHICTSVNDESVHGIPGTRLLQDGDIIGIDAGVIYQGYYSDMARTLPVGSVSAAAAGLIAATKQALQIAVDMAAPGVQLGDIGAAIAQYAESQGYGVIRALVGHGIGTQMHEEPQVPNYGVAGTGLTLEAGMTIAIEPMLNYGTHKVVFDTGDDWTVRTADGQLAAHFEDTVLITETGSEVLTSV